MSAWRRARSRRCASASMSCVGWRRPATVNASGPPDSASLQATAAAGTRPRRTKFPGVTGAPAPSAKQASRSTPTRRSLRTNPRCPCCSGCTSGTGPTGDTCRRPTASLPTSAKPPCRCPRNQRRRGWVQLGVQTAAPSRSVAPRVAMMWRIPPLARSHALAFQRAVAAALQTWTRRGIAASRRRARHCSVRRGAAVSTFTPAGRRATRGRTHMSEHVEWRSADVVSVVPGPCSMACAHLDVRRRCRAGAGAKLGGKPEGRPFHPGASGEGKTGRGALLEPSLMLVERSPAGGML
jgi:hypothetical protein